jgi:hypothetical protein
MKKLFRLSVLTITSLCANYFSTLAQDEQKAFNEGDKIISVGISGGGSSSGYSKLTPSISFDYGLKGTRGIVSVGGFLGYNNSNSQNYISNSAPFGGGGFGGFPLDTGTYYSLKSDYKVQTLTAGLRIGLHYSTRKWDLYAGTMFGYKTTLAESNSYITTTYKLNNNPLTYADKISESSVTYQLRTNGQFIFSPYVGARYFVTKKIAIGVEAGQHTGNVGLSFKF